MTDAEMRTILTGLHEELDGYREDRRLEGHLDPRIEHALTVIGECVDELAGRV